MSQWKYFELSDNENDVSKCMGYNLPNAEKENISINIYIRKEEKSKTIIQLPILENEEKKNKLILK